MTWAIGVQDGCPGDGTPFGSPENYKENGGVMVMTPRLNPRGVQLATGKRSNQPPIVVKFYVIKGLQNDPFYSVELLDMSVLDMASTSLCELTPKDTQGPTYTMSPSSACETRTVGLVQDPSIYRLCQIEFSSVKDSAETSTR